MAQGEGIFLKHIFLIVILFVQATNLGEPRGDDLTRELIFGNLEELALTSSVFDNVRVWFNNRGWAASVAYMNAANNIVLRASVKARLDDLDYWGQDDPEKFGIAVVNHPMNYTKDQLDTEVM